MTSVSVCTSLVLPADHLFQAQTALPCTERTQDPGSARALARPPFLPSIQRPRPVSVLTQGRGPYVVGAGTSEGWHVGCSVWEVVV